MAWEKAKDEIDAVNRWFEENEDRPRTYHEDNRYIINQHAIPKFCLLLHENGMGMVNIPCHVDEDGIWFTLNDLYDAYG